MRTLDGTLLGNTILQNSKDIIDSRHLYPRLDIIFVGSNKASQVYVAKKQDAGSSIGVNVVVHHYDSITNQELLRLVMDLNNDREVNAIIIQLPLPGMDPHQAMLAINPAKDVDGLNPLSLGKLWQIPDQPWLPATPAAIMQALGFIADAEQQTPEQFYAGKHAVIINRSDIIGKPLAAILIAHDCTVTIAHSQTINLAEITRQADILVSGTGKPGIITADMIKAGAIVIDAGFSKGDSGIWGDVNQQSIADKASWLSPVPGGIGPLGVAMLIANTVKAAEIQLS